MWLRIIVLTFCFIGFSFVAITGELDNSSENLTPYQYLNQLRVSAKMIPFAKSEALEKSAGNHARYLTRNQVIGHIEKKESAEFTGVKPGNRAVFAGYHTKVVTENVSLGQKNYIESIDGLMSAIYHRFAFLDFTKNEVGIAFSNAQEGPGFVYNMGNDSLSRFCQFAIFMNKEPFYKDICKLNEKVSVSKFNQIIESASRKNPVLVTWPPDGASEIPCAFYDEIPDPLPDLSISGYPVSIQFNPAFYKRVTLKGFRLYNNASDLEITPARLMNKHNDPNKQFTAYQFALFPIDRLDWGTTYRAEVVFMADGKKRNKTWTFTTKNSPYPMFVINAQQESLFLKPDKAYAIYIPPSTQFPYIGSFRWETRSNTRADVTNLDKNTLSLTLSGEICGEAQFILNDGRAFSARLSDQDNLNENYFYSGNPSLLCISRNIGNITSFKIEAKGETIKVKPDRDYLVEIETSGDVTNNIKLEYNKGMKIKVDHLSKNIIKIRLSGSPGQIASFFLENSKTFKAVLTHENKNL